MNTPFVILEPLITFLEKVHVKLQTDNFTDALLKRHHY